LDRRTNGPKGSGGASPTIVTSRTGDDVDDNEVTQATGIMAAPPRRTSRKAAGGTAPVTAAPANGDVSDRKANGTAAASDTPASDTPASETPPSDQSTGTPTAVGPTEASGPDGARGAEADATLTDLPAMPAHARRPGRTGVLEVLGVFGVLAAGDGDADGLTGRVRLGNARSAAEFAVIAGPDLPEDGHQREKRDYVPDAGDDRSGPR
jgi:hypothetical protein